MSRLPPAAQVLVSIQSIIMVPKPYFNEPGYAEEEGTPAGEQRSREYNDNLRAATLRHAVRDMLRRPPAGFESIVRSHFRLLRPLLERQVKRWVSEAQTDSTREGMLRTYAGECPCPTALARPTPRHLRAPPHGTCALPHGRVWPFADYCSSPAELRPLLDKLDADHAAAGASDAPAANDLD